MSACLHVTCIHEIHPKNGYILHVRYIHESRCTYARRTYRAAARVDPGSTLCLERSPHVSIGRTPVYHQIRTCLATLLAVGRAPRSESCARRACALLGDLVRQRLRRACPAALPLCQGGPVGSCQVHDAATLRTASRSRRIASSSANRSRLSRHCGQSHSPSGTASSGGVRQLVW